MLFFRSSKSFQSLGSEYIGDILNSSIRGLGMVSRSAFLRFGIPVRSLLDLHVVLNDGGQ